MVSLTATTSEISRDDTLVQHCQSSTSESSSERSIIAPVGSPISDISTSSVLSMESIIIWCRNFFEISFVDI